jgi:hypothetical protein
MMSFNDLLARRSKHRGKKRKRSEEKALKDAKKSNVEAVPTLDDAIHTIQSSLSVSPTTNTNTSSMKSLTNSILYVGVLAGANFPHQELWESWHGTVSQNHPTFQVEIGFVSRFVNDSLQWTNFVKEHQVFVDHPVSWGSIDEVRAILTLMARANELVHDGGKLRFVICDSDTIPGLTNITSLFQHENDVNAVQDKTSSSTNSTTKKQCVDTGYSRDMQYQCISQKTVDPSRLCQFSPWGMVVNEKMVRCIVQLERLQSAAVAATVTPPCWYKHFQAVPCASEVYFATIISWFGGKFISCCRERWQSPFQRETDSIVVQPECFFDGKQLNNQFFVLRRVTTTVSKSIWKSALQINIDESTVDAEKKSNGSITNATSITTNNNNPSSSSLSSSLSSASSSSSSSLRRFPQGGKSQRAAWYSDNYLISIDPPACGIGNKFFIYSAYRIYSSIHQKKMNIHNKKWLNYEVYKLPLSSDNSTAATNHVFQMLTRVPTNEDRSLIESVFKKTTMYLQWSPLILSWQRDIRSWFEPFVSDSIQMSINEYGQSGDFCSGSSSNNDVSNTDIGGSKDLVIHLRTGDIWEERVKSANVINGGFIYYTQPPAWFFSFIVQKYSYETINILTHVPNSQYVLSVVTALKNIKQVKNVRVLTGTLQSDFGLLLRAKNVIPSISTFCWWGIFLGNGWSNDRKQKKTVHIGRTGFWHPNSIHNTQYCMEFDIESDGDYVDRNEYLLTVSDKWQNTSEQRREAFSHVIPQWFIKIYGEPCK